MNWYHMLGNKAGVLEECKKKCSKVQNSGGIKLKKKEERREGERKSKEEGRKGRKEEIKISHSPKAQRRKSS